MYHICVALNYKKGIKMITAQARNKGFVVKVLEKILNSQLSQQQVIPDEEEKRVPREEKLTNALAFLGKKWVLHPEYEGEHRYVHRANF